MIRNAIIIRIDYKIGSNAEGQSKFSEEPPIALPCFLAPYSEIKWQLGAAVKDCSETVFVMDDDFATAAIPHRPGIGDRIVARFNDEADTAAVAMEIVLARPNKLGSISHLELFLKKV